MNKTDNECLNEIVELLRILCLSQAPKLYGRHLETQFEVQRMIDESRKESVE